MGAAVIICTFRSWDVCKVLYYSPLLGVVVLVFLGCYYSFGLPTSIFIVKHVLAISVYVIFCVCVFCVVINFLPFLLRLLQQLIQGVGQLGEVSHRCGKL